MNTIEKINLILKKTNISKVNLAKYLGVSRQMVYNYLDSDDLSKMPAEKCQLLFKLLDFDDLNSFNSAQMPKIIVCDSKYFQIPWFYNIHSTQIRERVKNNENIVGAVNILTNDYIKENNLYKT